MKLFLSVFVIIIYMVTVSCESELINKKPVIIRVKRKINGLGVRLEHEYWNQSLYLRNPSTSIFSPNFSLHLVNVDETGNTIFEDRTPSRKYIKKTERTIYSDEATNTVIHINAKHSNGQYKINGHISDQIITYEDGQYYITRKNISISKSKVLSNGELPTRRARHRRIRSTSEFLNPALIVSVNPELLVVVDYATFITLNENDREILNYVTLMINSVNNRFANMDDPKIRFTISGIRIISTPSAEPFIVNSVIPGNESTMAYDIDKILMGFSKWVYANSAILPDHDLAPLITGVNVQLKSSNGDYDGIGGLATVKGACLINHREKRDFGTSVSADINGIYAGVNTLAHELAHNLGAPHDGENSLSTCPESDGFIMSKKGYGQLSKFRFSKCSASAMKEFILSDDALCLHFNQAPYHEIPLKSPENAGDFMNMSTQCQMALKNPNAYVDLTVNPDEVCRNLQCKYPDEKNPTIIYTQTLNRVPADSSYCGQGGSCINGVCIYQTNMTVQCRRILNRRNAFVDLTVDPDSLCQNLVCRYPNEDNSKIVETKTTNQPAIDHSTCGRFGRCIQGFCFQPDAPPDMSTQCQSASKKPRANVFLINKSSDELCANLQCQYSDDGQPSKNWTIKFNYPPADFTPCGTYGNCFKKKCITGLIMNQNGSKSIKTGNMKQYWFWLNIFVHYIPIFNSF